MTRQGTLLAGAALCVTLAPATTFAQATVELTVTLEGLVALYAEPSGSGGTPDDGPAGATWALFPFADFDTQSSFLAHVKQPLTFSHGMNTPMAPHYIAIRIPLKHITGKADQKGELLLDPMAKDPYDPQSFEPRLTARLSLPQGTADTNTLARFGELPPVLAAGGDGTTPALLDPRFRSDGDLAGLSLLGAQLKFAKGWTITSRQALYPGTVAGTLSPAKVQPCHRKSTGISSTTIAACTGAADKFASYVEAKTSVTAAPVLTIQRVGEAPTDIPLVPLDGKVAITIQNAPAFAIVDGLLPREPGRQFEHSKLYYMLAQRDPAVALPFPYYFPLRSDVKAPGRYCSSAARFLVSPKE
jgi:hypothetical protein